MAQKVLKVWIHCGIRNIGVLQNLFCCWSVACVAKVSQERLLHGRGVGALAVLVFVCIDGCFFNGIFASTTGAIGINNFTHSTGFEFAVDGANYQALLPLLLNAKDLGCFFLIESGLDVIDLVLMVILLCLQVLLVGRLVVLPQLLLGKRPGGGGDFCIIFDLLPFVGMDVD